MAGLRQIHKSDRRQSMLDAAEAEFNQHGFQAARIEDIAARAMVVPATVYNHFGDKTGVLLALFEERIARQSRRLTVAARSRNTDLLAALDHFLDETLDVAAHPHLSAEMWREAYAASFSRGGERLGTFVAQDDRMVLEELIELFAVQRRQGNVPRHLKPEELAEIVFAVGTLHWMRWVNGQTSLDRVKAAVKRQSRLAIAAICGHNPGPRR